MSNNLPLTVKDLVWGKVDPYPWWPGKIIQIISQHNTQIYKVSFFGDSSYSFLKEQCITMFSFFDFDLNSSFPQNLKLQKAIKEANRLFFDKQTMNKSVQALNTASDFCQKLIEQVRQESSSIGAKADGDSNQQIFDCPETNHEIEVSDIFSTQITSDNVFTLIESLSLAGHGNTYSYSERKQTINYRQKLKQGLLAKYNLPTCLKENHQSSSQKSLNSQNRPVKKIRKVKTQKKLSWIKGKEIFNLNQDKIKQIVIKKLNKALAGHYMPVETKVQSKIIYDLIQQKSKGSSDYFMRLIIKSLQIFKTLSSQRKGQKLIQFFLKKLQHR